MLKYFSSHLHYHSLSGLPLNHYRHVVWLSFLCPLSSPSVWMNRHRLPPVPLAPSPDFPFVFLLLAFSQISAHWRRVQTNLSWATSHAQDHLPWGFSFRLWVLIIASGRHYLLNGYIKDMKIHHLTSLFPLHFLDSKQNSCLILKWATFSALPLSYFEENCVLK